MIDTIKYSVLGLFVLIFQWMLGDLFSIFGVIPSFLVIYIIYVGLTGSQLSAIWIGFVMGFTMDSLVGTDMIGMTAMALALTGYLAGLFHDRIVRVPVIMQYLIYTGFLLIYFTFTVLVMLQDSQWSAGNIVFLILLPKTIYTLGLMTGIFILLRVGVD
ncbi:MAG: rod shape-determining protein MreD [Candidatus Marinimicrobia bacterium]|nr:rod shape-determining protein MreD [Candidatus Neomarinimicrobiota bacterium]